MSCNYLTLSSLLLQFAISSSHAAVVIVASQENGNVVLRGSGTIDVTGLSNASSFMGPIEVGISRPLSDLRVGQPPDGSSWPLINFYEGDSLRIPEDTGPIPSFPFREDFWQLPFHILASAGEGDVFGVGYSFYFDEGDFVPFRPYLVVPDGYISGNLLLGMASFSNQTFETMGLEQGSYRWNWGAGPSSDSMVLLVVPEPTTFLLAFAAFSASITRLRKF